MTSGYDPIIFQLTTSLFAMLHPRFIHQVPIEGVMLMEVAIIRTFVSRICLVCSYAD